MRRGTDERYRATKALDVRPQELADGGGFRRDRDGLDARLARYLALAHDGRDIEGNAVGKSPNKHAYQGLTRQPTLGVDEVALP